MAETPGDDNHSFYNNIVRTTEVTAYQSILIKNTDELYNTLIQDWKKNIQLAAENGYSWAVLALFHVDTIFRGKVRVVDMLFPSEKFLRKCRKYNVIPIMDRIKNTADPFEVEYQIINDQDDESLHVAAITAEWKIPQDSSSDESDSSSSECA